MLLPVWQYDLMGGIRYEAFLRDRGIIGADETFAQTFGLNHGMTPVICMAGPPAVLESLALT